MITFHVQGALNLLLFNYSWVLNRDPSKRTKLKERINNLYDEFMFGSATAAYTLCIAAFTQLNRISSYHLFLCDTFLSVLTTVQKNIGQQTPLHRTLRVYFLGIQLLLIVLRSVTIHRLSSVWDNTGGKCFITFVDGIGSLNERDNVVLWLYIDLIWGLLGRMVPPLVVWLGLSEHWAPQNRSTKLILTILFGRIPAVFFYIWGLHWTIKLTIANQFLIDGDDEYSFGFGQVGALVTLCISIYRAYISYKGARCILWLGRSNSDQYFLDYKQQQDTANDNQTTLSGKSDLALSSLPT